MRRGAWSIGGVEFVTAGVMSTFWSIAWILSRFLQIVTSFWQVELSSSDGGLCYFGDRATSVALRL
jgi:hypothetical protein